MEGKLIKEEEEYYALYTNKGIFVSDVYGGSLGNRLSLKNCEAIENDYDLDELIEKEIADGKLHPNDGAKKEGILRGIQIALEILGDKKFSEEDISKAINFGVHVEAGNIDIDYKRYGTTENQFIQSLQKTEWDVEIVMEKEVGTKLHDDGREFFCTDGTKPRIDVNGCLILKRKENGR